VTFIGWWGERRSREAGGRWWELTPSVFVIETRRGVDRVLI
jgi:hypothetical protein